MFFVNHYTYNDGKAGNNHFFVIVEQNNIAVPIESFGMLISSNLEKLKYKSNVKLEKDEILIIFVSLSDHLRLRHSDVGSG